MTREKPIFAETYFRITPIRIHQTLYFYYNDPSKNYFHLKKTGASEGELEVVQTNLQYWIVRYKKPGLKTSSMLNTVTTVIFIVWQGDKKWKLEN